MNIKFLDKFADDIKKAQKVSKLMMFFGFLILVFVGSAQVKAVFKTLDEIKQKQQIIEKLKKKNNQLKNIQTIIDDQNIQKINELLPSYKPIKELIINIDTAAKNSDIGILQYSTQVGEIEKDTNTNNITQQKIQKAKKQNNYLEMQLKIIGEFSNIQKFTSLLEKMSPFMTVTKMDMVYKETKSNKYLATTDIYVRIFYFNQTDKIVQKIDEPLPEITDAQKQVLKQIVEFIPNNIKYDETIIESNREDLFNIDNLR